MEFGSGENEPILNVVDGAKEFLEGCGRHVRILCW